MKIQFEEQANGTAYATVTIEPEDYEDVVANELKKIRREINLPGFRPGMVPKSIVNKKYRKSVLVNTTGKLSYDSLEDYLKKENIEIIGDIIVSEKQTTIDFDSSTSFDFMFKCGIRPKVVVSLSKKNSIEKPVLVPDEDMIKKYTESFLSKFAELKDFDTVEPKDTLHINLDNGDMQIFDAVLFLRDLTEEQSKLFEGKKVGDKVDVDITQIYPKEEQRATVLSLKMEELEGVNPKFALEIVKIQRVANPEINDEFFERAYPQKDVTTKEQMDEKLYSELTKLINDQIQWGFWDNVVDYLISQVEVKLPDDFLKEWLYIINENKFTKEQIEAEYPKFAKSMKWEIIRSSILIDNGISVDEEFMKAEAKLSAANIFKGYGIDNVPDEYLEDYAAKLLDDKEQSKTIYESAITRKTIEIILDTITVNEKQMTMDQYKEFNKNKSDNSANAKEDNAQ